MDDLDKHMKFKSLDHFIFTKLAYKINKVTEHSKRKVFQCAIDPQSQCNFTAFYRNVCELNRLFNHFQKLILKLELLIINFQVLNYMIIYFPSFGVPQ